jgi:Pyridoxamine 5'-phosphate oxidase
VTQPPRSRPQIPESYGIPKSSDGMLPWSHVVRRLREARNYWVATTRPDGRPHTVPVWGVWVGEVLYHGGGHDTRRARNLDVNPYLVIHLESGDQVVIIEGKALKLTEDNADPDLLRRVDDAYEAKYGMRHGTPVWALQPHRALAWTEYPTTATRWEFEADNGDV